MSLFGRSELDLRSWWHSIREYASIVVICILGIILAFILLRVLFFDLDKAGALAVYNAAVTNGALDDLAGYTATAGDLAWIPLMFWMYVFRRAKHGWHSSLILGVAVVTAMVLVEFLKRAFNVPRPFQPVDNPKVPSIIPKFETPIPINPGFPSGHTTNAFTTAVVLFGRYRKWGWIFLGLAVGTGLSMVHLGLHFPSDVIAGAFLGTFCGTFVLGLAKHREDF